MLIPKRTKYRKQHRPVRSGMSKGGNEINFGDFAIQSLAPAYVTNRQIEAARIAMTRYIKRGGRVWITIFPDRPLTKHPLGARMGSGKGAPEFWIANVRPGRVMFEIGGVSEDVAKEALRVGLLVEILDGVISGTDCHQNLNEKTNAEIEGFLKKSKEELFNLRFQHATGQLENTARLKAVKSDIARMYTVLRERELGISQEPAATESKEK